MTATTESPSPSILVALTLLTVGCLASWPLLRRAWRGEAEIPVRPVGLTHLFRNPTKRQRMGVSVIVSANVLALAGWSIVLASMTDDWRALAIIGPCTWVVSIAMMISVYAFGWPRLLVPPHLRGDHDMTPRSDCE